MAHALSEVLPLAIGVAISPLPVAAVLLMLISRRERINAGAFLAGWAVTLVAIATAATLSGISVHASDLPDDVNAFEVAAGIIGIAAGAIALGVIAKRSRGPRKTPAWLARIDQFSPLGACALAVVLLVLNVKDVALTLAAGSQISSAALPTHQAVVAVVAFALVASSAIGIPVAVALAAGDSADPHLRRWHSWTEWHGDKALAVIVMGAGVLLLATGLRGL